MIVFVMTAPPPVSLATFSLNLSAQKTVRTVFSSDLHVLLLLVHGNHSLISYLAALAQSQYPTTYHMFHNDTSGALSSLHPFS